MAVEITTTFDYEGALGELGEQGRRAIPRAVELMAIEAWGNIAREAPVDHGRLAGSFELTAIDPLSWRIATNVYYADFVRSGTRPHIILPVHAQALYWKGADHPVKIVHHPGTAPNDYIGRAMEKAQSRSEEFASRAIRETG